MSDTARIAVVGCGGMGRGHAQRAIDAGHEVVAGVDVADEPREAFAEEYGVPTFEDDEALHDAVDVDGVVVTTPNAFHEQSAVAALERDVNVLVEKPLAHTLESGERIAAAARESAGFCMVGFHNRYSDPAEVLKARIDGGDFGEVRHVEANYVRRRGIPGLGSWFTTKDLAGGGALIDIGVHVLDMAMHFLDFPQPVEVSGVARADFGTRDDYNYLSMYGEEREDATFDVDDAAHAFVRFDDGSTVVLNAAWATNSDGSHSVDVYGTDAGASLDVVDDDLTVYETRAEGAGHNVDQHIETAGGSGHAAELADFCESIATGSAPRRNTVKQGLMVQRVLDGIYRSSETGRAVPLDE